MRLHLVNYKILGSQQRWTLILALIIINIIFLPISSCNLKSSIMPANIDVQGHRGCRGLRPENTIAAFKKAVDIGVNTLELDVVVNKFNDVIVSHEPFFNHEIATGPNGEEISEKNEKEFNMYSMTLEEIQSYDVGLKLHPRFLNQKKVGVKKPTLREMVNDIEAYIKTHNYKPLAYNIEIKRVKQHDGVFHPDMKNIC